MEPESYQRYERAKKHVKALKGFYDHIKIFVLINILILVTRFVVLPRIGIVSDDEGFNNWLNWNTFIFPAIWAVAILIHGLSVYRVRLFRGWEERKIKELMEKEDQESNNFEN